MSELELIARARRHGGAVALREPTNQWSYQQLLDRSATLAAELLGGDDDLREARVALLAPAGVDYVAAQWAIWRGGGVAVPLSLSAAEPEWEEALTDSQASCVVASPDLAEKIAPLCRRLRLRLQLGEPSAAPAASTAPPLPSLDPQRRAMILYTSGTTSKPKGVVATHANLQAQIETLVEAWEWRPDDRIPLFLPLHHVHGIVNILACGLWSGAVVEPFAHFDLSSVSQRVAAEAYTVFMAVPTIYVKLIRFLEDLDGDDRAKVVAGFAKMRLMVSGSAALPASVHARWFELTGQQLLERYGMTEIGMALSNPFHGERRPGTVGQPLPHVEIRLKSENEDRAAAAGEPGEPGEIQVRGPGVFREYWNRPEATAKAFRDGWFQTGDVAVLEQGYYRIMGRLSVDIIKSGGYKLSALEIEAALLQHPSICECAVVGVPDETWGEMVAVAAVPHPSATLDLPSLRDWCRDRLSAYKIPRQLLLVDQLPRNAMGKVTKPAVRDLFEPQPRQPSSPNSDSLPDAENP